MTRHFSRLRALFLGEHHPRFTAGIAATSTDSILKLDSHVSIDAVCGLVQRTHPSSPDRGTREAPLFLSEMNVNHLVALLPTKAHSVRVPAKNFRPLSGRPLFQWGLQTLI